MLAAQVLRGSGAFSLIGRLIKLIIWCPKGFQAYWPALHVETVSGEAHIYLQSPKGPRSADQAWLSHPAAQAGGSGFFCQESAAWEGFSTIPGEQWVPALHLQKPSHVFTPGYVSIFPYAQARSEFYTCLFTQILHLPGEPSCRLVLELLDLEARIYSVPSRVLALAKKNSVAAGSWGVWNSYRPLWNQGLGGAEGFGPCCCFHRVETQSLSAPPAQAVFFFCKPQFPPILVVPKHFDFPNDKNSMVTGKRNVDTSMERYSAVFISLFTTGYFS